MAIELKVTLEGDVELSRRLLTIPDKIDNWYMPLYRVGQEVHRSVDANYSGRGSLFGKWEPRKDNKPHPLLEKTKAMRNSFANKLGPNYLHIYNTAPYFKYHQSNQPRKRLPRRVMLKIDRERQQFIQKEFQAHIINSMKE